MEKVQKVLYSAVVAGVTAIAIGSFGYVYNKSHTEQIYRQTPAVKAKSGLEEILIYSGVNEPARKLIADTVSELSSPAVIQAQNETKDYLQQAKNSLHFSLAGALLIAASGVAGAIYTGYQIRRLPKVKFRGQ